MPVPETTRAIDPQVKKRQFIEQQRATEEERRRQESQSGSAEASQVIVQVCAAGIILHALLDEPLAIESCNQK